MEPDLKAQARDGQSSNARSHGDPYRTARWLFHPEHEPHFVTATEGNRCDGGSNLPPSQRRLERGARFAPQPEKPKVFGGASKRSRAAAQHAKNANEPASAP